MKSLTITNYRASNSCSLFFTLPFRRCIPTRKVSTPLLNSSHSTRSSLSSYELSWSCTISPVLRPLSSQVHYKWTSQFKSFNTTLIATGLRWVAWFCMPWLEGDLRLSCPVQFPFWTPHISILLTPDEHSAVPILVLQHTSFWAAQPSRSTKFLSSLLQSKNF